MLWMVGLSKTHQLLWRSDTVVLDVRNLWGNESVAMDIRNFHDDSVGSSMLERRGTMLTEVREGMG